MCIAAFPDYGGKMIDEGVIKLKIEKLRGELDRLVAQANQQIAAYQAAIQVLEELIAPPPEAEDEK